MVTYLNDIDSLSVYNGTAFTTDRTIQVFAGTAARGSAIGTAVEGMYTHINETDSLEYYDGSAWVAAGGSGKILQVVSENYSTEVTTSSPTYVTTGLSATITPSSTSSKIAVFVSTVGRLASNVTAARWTIFRGTTGGTDLAPGSSGFARMFVNTNVEFITSISGHLVDSPNTTGPQTYTLAFRLGSTGSSAASQFDSGLGNIILMEVAG
jgi:hypothetical protein